MESVVTRDTHRFLVAVRFLFLFFVTISPIREYDRESDLGCASAHALQPDDYMRWQHDHPALDGGIIIWHLKKGDSI